MDDTRLPKKPFHGILKGRGNISHPRMRLEAEAGMGRFHTS
jgi:hypothetical protein